jgi:hypothetical protein
VKRTAASDSAEPFGPELKAEGLVAGRQSQQKRPDDHPTPFSVMSHAKSNVDVGYEVERGLKDPLNALAGFANAALQAVNGT